MATKILFVDDDPNILSAYQRTLRKQYQVVTASGGAEGLARVQREGPFPVVVSDMRMPGMDGVQFLTNIRAQAPDTIRIMLTGQADMQDAINAVNEGNIFRFLTKPCNDRVLVNSLEAALEQHRLVRAERELLEQTLNGAIKILTEVLSLANPEAFSRAERIKRIVQHLCDELALADRWQVEVAAMLSQLGCVTLPQDLLKRFHVNAVLAPDELKILESVPLVGRDLLIHIPRLESVAQIIIAGAATTHAHGAGQPLEAADPVSRGGALLKLAASFDDLIVRKKLPPAQAVGRLSDRKEWAPALIDALSSLVRQNQSLIRRDIAIIDLQAGMLIAEDVKTTQGVLLVPSGKEVNSTLIHFLMNYKRRGEVENRIPVMVPQ